MKGYRIKLLLMFFTSKNLEFLSGMPVYLQGGKI